MTKIIHVVISLEPGGLERLVVDMTNERNERQPGSTRVACLDRRGSLADQVEGESVFCVDAERSKFPWDRRAAGKIKQIITTENAETRRLVLHAHNTAAWQYAVLAARGTEAKVVVTHHGSNRYTHGFINNLRNRWLCNRTDAVVAVSRSVKQELREAWGFHGADMRVIPNGVRVDADATDQMIEYRGPENQQQITNNQELRKEFGIPPDSFVIGYVGRLSREKGVDRLIAAFAAMVHGSGERLTPRHEAAKGARMGDAPRQVGEVALHKEEGQCGISSSATNNVATEQLHLLLIGDGDQRSALERQSESLGVKDRVIFAGYRDDARELMKVMDLFVLPSRSEGLPVALLEAMAAGVSVAATDAGESRAVLRDGELGSVLPNDDSLWPEILQEQLLGSKNAERLDKARKHVAENYSFDAMLTAYEQLYSKVLEAE